MAFHQYRCRSNAISMPRPSLSLNTSKPTLSLSIPKTPTALPTSRRTSPPTPSSHVPVAFSAPPPPPRLSIPTDHLPSISMPRAPVLENSQSSTFFNYPQRSASPPPSSSESGSLSRPKLSPRDERAKIVAGLILNRHSTKRSCPLGGAALRACHNKRYVNTPLRVEVC